MAPANTLAPYGFLWQHLSPVWVVITILPHYHPLGDIVLPCAAVRMFPFYTTTSVQDKNGLSLNSARFTAFCFLFSCTNNLELCGL